MKLKKVLLDLLTGPTLGVWLARPFLCGSSWQWEPGDPTSSEMPAASFWAALHGYRADASVWAGFPLPGKRKPWVEGLLFPFPLRMWHCLDFIFVIFKENKLSFPLWKNHLPGTSQVVQELRFCLPVQRVRVWSLVRELDPMWLVTKKPKHKQQKQ